MDERRSAKRWRIADYCKGETKCTDKYFGVYARTENQFIGYLIDLSSEGMMVLSKKVIPEGTTLKLRIELPEEIRGSDQLLVEVRSVWSEKDSKPGFNRIGFAFTFTNPHHAEIIGLLFRHCQPDETIRPEKAF